MKRRKFITLVGGAAAWSLLARAQQGEQMRRIGVLMSAVEGDESERKITTDRLTGLIPTGIQIYSPCREPSSARTGWTCCAIA